MAVHFKNKNLILFGLLLVCVAGLAFSYFIEPRRLVAVRYEIVVRDLPEQFEKFRIVAISDIHAGSNGGGKEQLRRLVGAVNSENADLIVLLGDYVSESSDGLRMDQREMGRSIAGLTAKYGTFAVLGNHDGPNDRDAIVKALTDDGYRVLDGETAVVEKDGAKLRFVGLKDQLTIRSWRQFSDDVKMLVSPEDGTGPLIALSHSPDVLPIIATDGTRVSPDLRLMIAGHTHGGQISLPIIGRPLVPSFYGQRYAYGHHRYEDVDLVVTSGIGTSVFPLRFMVPPEYAVITLKKE